MAERLEIHCTMDVAAAIRAVQELIGRFDALDSRIRQTGQTTVQSANMQHSQIGRVAEAINKYKGEYDKAGDAVKKHAKDVGETGKAVESLATQTGRSVQSMIGAYVSLAAALATVRQIIGEVDQRLMSISQASISLSAENFQQAMTAFPIMEAFALRGQPDAQGTSIRMMNEAAQRFQMQPQQAAAFLTSMGSSIGGDPRRVAELQTIASLAARSGLTKENDFDLLKSIFTGTGGQLVDQKEIERRASMVQFGLLKSGKSDPGAFLTGLGAVLTQRVPAGGDWNKAFMDYLTLTGMSPAGRAASNQAQMVMRALQAEEPQAREKLTSIYAGLGLMKVAEPTDAEIDAIVGRDEDYTEYVRDAEDDLRKRRAAMRRHTDPERRAEAQKGIEEAQHDHERRRNKVRATASKAEISRRRKSAFAAMGPDERMELAKAAIAAAEGDPEAMDAIRQSVGGQQIRMEAVQRWATKTGRDLTAEYAREIAGGGLDAARVAAEQGQAETVQAREAVRLGQEGELISGAVTFGDVLHEAFSKTAEKHFIGFQAHDPEYVGTWRNAPGIYRPQVSGEPGFERGGGQTQHTMEGARQANRSVLLIKTIKKYEQMFREAGDIERANQMKALGLKYESILFFSFASTRGGIASDIASAFQEMGPIIEGFRKRGGAFAKVPSSIGTGEPQVAIPPAGNVVADLGPASDFARGGHTGHIPAGGAGLLYNVSIGNLFTAPGGRMDFSGRLNQSP